MELTEREMTLAVRGAAQAVLAGRRDVRRGRQDLDELWEQMDRRERYQLLSSVGDQVLPALRALPDVDVAPGERPTATDAEVQEAVEATAPDDLGRMRRTVLLRARAALVRAALDAVPPRADPTSPETLDVPDHL